MWGDIIAGAGIGSSTGLSGSALDFDALISKLDDADVERYLAELGVNFKGHSTLCPPSNAIASR